MSAPHSIHYIHLVQGIASYFFYTSVHFALTDWPGLTSSLVVSPSISKMKRRKGWSRRSLRRGMRERVKSLRRKVMGTTCPLLPCLIVHRWYLPLPPNKLPFQHFIQGVLSFLPPPNFPMCHPQKWQSPDLPTPKITESRNLVSLGVTLYYTIFGGGKLWTLPFQKTLLILWILAQKVN